MGFNPCGRIVDLLQDAYTDTIKPYAGADLEVTRRWYKVGDDVPTLGIPSTFLSEFSEAFPYLERDAGFVWPTARDTMRRLAPGGLTYDHVCGTAADFAGLGAFDPTRTVVYDDEWIPECCGATDVCVSQLCSQDEENGFQAAQLRSYPVPHQVATGTTPVEVEHWGQNLGNDPAGWPGRVTDWFPAGEDNTRQYQMQRIADDNGDLQFQVDRWSFGAVDAITRTINGSGLGFDFALAGDVGGMALEFVGGVLTLSGAMLVAKSVLPADTSYLDSLPVAAVGTTQAGAAPLAAGGHMLYSSSVANTAFVLVASPGAVVDVYPSAARAVNVFPHVGGLMFNQPVNAPFVVPAEVPGGPYYGYRFSLVITALAQAQWLVEKFQVDGSLAAGTVTSVGISTSSTAVTVGGGPITGAGTLTVDVSSALDDLDALAAGSDLVAGDGAGGYAPVTIGDYLAFAGGVLNVVPPTATAGAFVAASYTITGTSGTYQATGQSFTLPAAGTYEIVGMVTASLVPTAAGGHVIRAKLRNTTAGADLADSFMTCVAGTGSGVGFSATGAMLAQITVTGATTLELYAARYGTSWALSEITSSANGKTVFSWKRLY